MIEKNIYNLSSEEVLNKFNTSFQGISEVEAEKRLLELGKNQIEKKQNWKWAKLILGQFNDTLVWILLVAAFLALLFHEIRDMTIILIIIGINASIGFFQEFKAERILDQIKKLTRDKALVLRGGEKKEIDAKLLVPGDIILVTSGDIVPADAYILEAFEFKVSSFIFTGESRPEKKLSKAIKEQNVALADIDNIAFMGETVASGEARMVVVETGSQTELGKIANLAQEVGEQLTPMQKQMRVLGRDITVLAVFIGVIVMIAGQYFKVSLYQNFLFALALAVSVVPEGLPAAISVTLSLGMKRLLKENVLAKKLNAVETLGSVDMICTDKTGTITKNELMAVKIFINDEILEITGDGYCPQGNFRKNNENVSPQSIENLELLMKIGTLCNNATLVQEGDNYKIIGDPTEGAIIVAGKKYNSKEEYFETGEKKINENPFSSERMRMSVVYQNEKAHSFVKGSPDVLLDLCKFKKISSDISELTAEEKKRIKKTYDDMSAGALRVLAFAFRDLSGVAEENYFPESERDLVWVGMMAMTDPPRKDVKSALEECHSLGIEVLMITGDYAVTARAIAKNVGLIGDGENQVISGQELNMLSDEEIFSRVEKGTRVFARIAPEQKLRIADILKNNDKVIAMTGDGVNDAPALKCADIGVAMGIIGTDVSKESADMILLDDNFASIVKGIREGRKIFQNLKKFVHYVLTSNASELFTVIMGVLFGIPAPITAIQILATDLGTDVFPSFSLGLEPEEPNADKKKKDDSSRRVMTFKGFNRIIYLGIIMASGAALAFVLSMLRGGWEFGMQIAADSALYIKSTSASYAVISMTQMANVLQSRSETLSPFQLGFFKNKYVIGSILISVGILLTFMYLPFCQKYLKIVPIDWEDWFLVIVATIAVFLAEEARKEDK